MGLRERCSLLAVAILVGSVALATVPTADGSQRMAIARGKIVDQDGNPLPGVEVSMEYWYMGPRLSIGGAGAGGGERITETNMRRSGNRTETKEDGTFSYPSLDADAEYRVRFEKEGFIPKEEKRVFHVAANDMGTMVLISGNVEAARKAYDAGYSAFGQRDFPAAISAMEEVVDVYGDSDSSDEMLIVALGVLGQAYLQQNQPTEAETSLNRLLEILQRASEAIAYAHERGVAHLDLTPAKSDVGEYGEVTVIDWGALASTRSRQSEEIQYKEVDSRESRPLLLGAPG